MFGSFLKQKQEILELNLKRDEALFCLKMTFGSQNIAFRDLEKVNKIIFRLRIGTEKSIASALTILGLENTKEILSKTKDLCRIIDKIYEEKK